MGNDNSGNDEKVKYEEVGRNAAKDLASDWNSSKGGCTDRHGQDQLILFMALAKGKSKMATCALELHTETAIYVAELMTGVKFKVSNMKDGTVMIECVGIGYNVSGIESMDMKSVQRAVESAEQKNDDDVEEEEEEEEDDDDARRNYLFKRPSL